MIPSIVTNDKEPNVGAENGADHITIVPREYLNAFFFDRMSVYRNNICKIFTKAEQVYHTITYKY